MYGIMLQLDHFLIVHAVKIRYRRSIRKGATGRNDVSSWMCPDRDSRTRESAYHTYTVPGHNNEFNVVQLGTHIQFTQFLSPSATAVCTEVRI